MVEKRHMEARISNRMEEMEGVRGTTGISSIYKTENVQAISAVPDPEVREKAVRRRFTAAYKLQILREAERCREHGRIGALSRREGLYSSNLVTWRRQREHGTLEALSPKKRGRKAQEPDPSARRIAELERENERLQKKLKQAETTIDVQKKVSEILRIPLAESGEKHS